MKTNPKQAANGRSRPANGRRAPLVRGGVPTTSVKNRIGKPTAKPTGDLRQMLAKKVAKPSPTKPSEPSSNVKSRLGLQSQTARLEAQREAKAQMQAIRDKNVSLISSLVQSFWECFQTTTTGSPISLRLLKKISHYRNLNQLWKHRRLHKPRAPYKQGDQIQEHRSDHRQHRYVCWLSIWTVQTNCLKTLQKPNGNSLFADSGRQG